MATKIRLRRAGRRKQASYRIVVSGGAHARDGRFTEQIGKYNPRTDPAFIEIDEERAMYWLERGAEASDTVRSIFRRAGILEKIAKGAEPEGVVTIGDVGGKTVFPTAGPAKESPAAKAEVVTEADEPATAEEEEETEEEEEEGKKEAAVEAEAESEDEDGDEDEKSESGGPQAAVEAGSDDEASAEEAEEDEVAEVAEEDEEK